MGGEIYLAVISLYKQKRLKTHRIHGTGICTPTFTIQSTIHCHVGKYTVRPMDPSWEYSTNTLNLKLMAVSTRRVEHWQSIQ